jgi:hypothetical protein
VKLALLVITAAILQGVQPPHLQQPTLPTATQIAFRALEQQKQAAEQSINQAQQAEDQIMREFSIANPGWHIDPKNLAIVKDVKKP